MDRPETKKYGRPRLDLKVKSSICTSPLYRKKWWLVQKFCVEKLSAREIAVLVGHSHHAVNQALKKFGLIREPSKTGRLGFGVRFSSRGRTFDARLKRVIAWMARMQERGASYLEIARELQKEAVNPPGGGKRWYGGTVRNILKKNRIQ